MKKPSNRLEEALQSWETLCFLMGRVGMVNGETLANLGGCFQNFQDFRKFLLSRNQTFPPEKFFGDEETMRNDRTAGGWLTLPYELHKWSCASRRIYRLTEDMQRFLETTSIKNITWNDVTLPFNSFGIALPIPFRTHALYPGMFEGEAPATDFILLTRLPTLDGSLSLQTRLIGINPAYVHPSKEQRERIDWFISKRRFAEAGALLQEKLKTFGKGGYSSITRYDIPKEHMSCTVVSTLANMFIAEDTKIGTAVKEELGVETDDEKLNDTARSNARILIGLCLYIQSTSKKDTQTKLPREKWEKPATTVDPRSLVSESEVCIVTAEGLLNDIDRRFHQLIKEKGFAQALKEMGVHFRTAHWRRPKGKGDDPTAEKTISVRSTIVRPDRLPEGGLPGGTEVRVE